MGDPACWLDRVCLECGRFIDDDHVEDETCPHCDAPRDPVELALRHSAPD